MEGFVVVPMIADCHNETYPEVRYDDNPSQEIVDIATSQDLNEELGNGKLCGECERYGLDRASFEPNPDYSAGAIGSIRTFLNAQCALCRLVRLVLHSEQEYISSNSNDTDSLGFLRFWDKPITDSYASKQIGWRLYWETGQNLLELKSPPELRRLHVSLVSLDEREKEMYRTFNSIEPFSDPKTTELFLGRAYQNSQINPALILKWINCCGTWHHGECKNSFRSNFPHPATELEFYAIDVIDMKLVQLTPKQNYCALSYVWGSSQHYRLTKNNIAALKLSKGLTGVLKQIPQTILDAICLTKMLGLNFLWVDCICLPQDDEKALKAAFGRMHLVYSKAILTIVNASGKDVHSGLPGLRQDTRGRAQAVARIGDLESGLVLGSQPRYQRAIYFSPHGQRAWTYQELCFSSRSLVFLEGMVFFQCQQAVWREDAALEHQGVRFWLHEMDNRFREKTDILSQYRHNLQEYTRRKLSFECDALKAYSGVLEAQRRMFPKVDIGVPICGIHRNLVDWVMLFYCLPGTKRRGELPSWSWAGWIGQTILPYPAFQSPRDLFWWKREHSCAKYEYGELGPLFREGSLKTVTDLLILTAPIVAFHMDSTPIFEKGFATNLYVLRDSRGKICGYTTLHEECTSPRMIRESRGGRLKVAVLSDRIKGQGLFPTGPKDFKYDAGAELEPDARTVEQTETHPKPPSTGSSRLPRLPSCIGTLIGAVTFEQEAQSARPSSKPRRRPTPPFTNWEGKIDAKLCDDKLDHYNVMAIVERCVFDGKDKRHVLFERIGSGIIHNQSIQWRVEDDHGGDIEGEAAKTLIRTVHLV